MANLYNSAKEGVDTTDVLSFPTLQMKNAASTTICTRRASKVRDVQCLHARERQLTSKASEAQYREAGYKGQRHSFESEIARRKSEVQNLKQDSESIRLTNDSNSQRNTEFIEPVKELIKERIKLREEVMEVRKRSTISACCDRV